MGKDKKPKKKKLFFPYYINQSRLLDIYAILNGGYSEYSEITTTVSVQKSKSGKVDGQASGGFKLVNLGGTLSGNLEKNDEQSSENREKKVHTITSILSMVRAALANKGYLVDILKAEPGDFVCLPVNLQINSIKSMLSEMVEILKLADNMQKIGAEIKGAGKNTRQYEDMLKSMQVLFAGEEILYETENFAVFGESTSRRMYIDTRMDHDEKYRYRISC